MRADHNDAVLPLFSGTTALPVPTDQTRHIFPNCLTDPGKAAPGPGEAHRSRLFCGPFSRSIKKIKKSENLA
ncbi:hypothetical protein AD954_05590 [Acetobacter cerevisiae]|uniref:Uncharacterized protein n=1 Tax=Acetobacter cerevisiae TaxID=178900 RepID=A0A149VCL2_9PROT|nr:hypothetical protein AD954_05590 [Acetobacter cerevisiae]